MSARLSTVGLVTFILSVLNPALAKDSYSWRGVYGGFFVGDGWQASSDLPSVPALAPGVLAGGQLGLNFTSGRLTFGLETDLALPDLANSPVCFHSSDCTQDLGREFVGSFRARGGLTLDRLYFYGTAGYAASNLANDQSTLSDLSPAEFQSGWTLGGGVEVGLTDHLRSAIEFRSTKYDRATLDLTAPHGLLPSSDEILLKLNFH